MKIEHVAIWTEKLEFLKDYYVTYFGAKTNTKYYNPHKIYPSFH